MAETPVTAPQRVMLFARSRYIGCFTRMAARESTARAAAHASGFRPPVAHQVDDRPAAWELPA
jgi:hypothetical protein